MQQDFVSVIVFTVSVLKNEIMKLKLSNVYCGSQVTQKILQWTQYIQILEDSTILELGGMRNT